MRALIAFTLSVLLIGQPLIAQLRAGGETIEVRLVEVVVNVVDAQGNPVRGLTASNFEIQEEGKKRPITHFEVTDYKKPAAATPALESALRPARRNFMLLFDLTNSTPSSLLRATQAASQFINTQALPGDRVAVGTTSVQRGFHLLSSFTTDRNLVSRAVATLGAPKFFQVRDPLLLTVEELGGPVDDPAVRAYIEELVALGQRLSNDALRNQVDRELTGLTDLARSLDRISGRKHVILLSEGFDPRMLHGRESLSSQEARQDQTRVERGAIWEVDTDNTYGDTASAAALKRMTEAFRRSDVILHAMDIKGLRTDVDAREGVRPRSNEALFLLSRDTGGQLFKNSNELAEEFGRFLRSQEVVYTLGYSAPRLAPGTFRRLQIKVIGVPGARVSHRLGYYEPATAANVLDRTLEAGDIIMNRIPIDEVRHSALAIPIPGDDQLRQVPVVLEIDGRAIVEGAGTGNVALAEIFVYAFDSEDVIRDRLYQRVAFEMAKVGEKLSGKGIKFYGTLRLPPGEYSLRTLVRSGQRNGFQSTALRVPRQNEQYIASPLVFDTSDGWVMVRAGEQSTGEYPFQIGETTFIPGSVPVLAKAKANRMALFTYNFPLEGLKVKAALRGPSGTDNAELSLVGRTAPDQHGVMKLLLDITPPQGESGPRVLVVSIAGPSGTDAQEISIPVSIQ